MLMELKDGATIQMQTKQITTAKFITASGGTVTTSGNFKIHTFTSDGTFTVSEVGNPANQYSRIYGCSRWRR